MLQALNAMIEGYGVKALRQLKANIETLLAHRKEDQATLARWCHHSKAWINKFLNDPEASIQIKDLDKIADFFGIAPYQLFQPGISAITERRKSGDRRSGHERRIGHAGRHLANLRAEHNKLPSRGAYGGGASTGTSADVEREIQFHLDRIDELHAIRAGRQAPTTRPARPAGPQPDRKSRRQAAKEGH